MRSHIFFSNVARRIWRIWSLRRTTRRRLRRCFNPTCCARSTRSDLRGPTMFGLIRSGGRVRGHGSGGVQSSIATRMRRSVKFTCRRTLEFQIDPRTGPAYVNFPDARQIAVVDLDARRVLATCPMVMSAPTSRWRLIQRMMNLATGAVRQTLPIALTRRCVSRHPARARLHVAALAWSQCSSATPRRWRRLDWFRLQQAQGHRSLYRRSTVCLSTSGLGC